MITVDDAPAIHSVLIEKFGGATGIRDKGALEAALNRPYATFDNKELYPHTADKAAAIVESILINHPFVDGNKRTGYTLLRLTLMNYGFDLVATEKEKYDFVISIASGEMNIDGIKDWIHHHLK